ncbi:hypothetical protein BTVI_04009 [Pitangus sulphuratus]|nr:hypothetical protein BTVI_04009 [Pitangus sulphuratus]
MEQILLEVITSQMKHMIGKSQHRITRGKSCLTNLITFFNKVTYSVDVGQEVEFFKAFHRISYSYLLEKQTCYSLDNWSVFISDVEDGIKCSLIKFANDPKFITGRSGHFVRES